MAKRPNLYPDGRVIAIILPESYQQSNLPDVPAGEMCSACIAYNPETSQCKHWYGAYVRPGWWCKSYTPKQ